MTDQLEERCGRPYPPRPGRDETRVDAQADNVVPMHILEDKRQAAKANTKRALKIVRILKKLINEDNCRQCQLRDGSNVLGFVVPFGADVYIVETIRDFRE